MLHPLALHIPFFDEWMVIAFFGLLLFGKRLPEVGRSVGKGIVEFKKGLAGIEDEIELAGKPQANAANTAIRPATNALPAEGHKFDPYTGEPIKPQLANVPPGAKFDPYTGKPLNAEVVTTEQPQTTV